MESNNEMKLTYIDELDGVEKELCVLCKARTDIPVYVSIHSRTNYIDSIGQLCDKCAREVKAEAKPIW